MHALWALSIAMARLPNTPSSLSHPSAPPIRSMPARRPVESRRTRAQNHATTLYIHTHLLTPSCSGCSVRRALRSSFLLLLLVDLLDAVLGLLASHMLSQAATPHHGIDCRWMDGKTWVPVREAHPKRAPMVPSPTIARHGRHLNVQVRGKASRPTLGSSRRQGSPTFQRCHRCRRPTTSVRTGAATRRPWGEEIASSVG